MKNLSLKPIEIELCHAPVLSLIDMSLCNEVAAITALAILSNEVAYIEVKFSPRFHALEVKVFDSQMDCLTDMGCRFSCAVPLDSSNALEQLKALEDKLLDVVTEAKEHEMGG